MLFRSVISSAGPTTIVENTGSGNLLLGSNTSTLTRNIGSTIEFSGTIEENSSAGLGFNPGEFYNGQYLFVGGGTFNNLAAVAYAAVGSTDTDTLTQGASTATYTTTTIASGATAFTAVGNTYYLLDGNATASTSGVNGTTWAWISSLGSANNSTLTLDRKSVV